MHGMNQLGMGLLQLYTDQSDDALGVKHLISHPPDMLKAAQSSSLQHIQKDVQVINYTPGFASFAGWHAFPLQV
jgi:hypothetical protein